jgi:hypothetical protein
MERIFRSYKDASLNCSYSQVVIYTVNNPGRKKSLTYSTAKMIAYRSWLDPQHGSIPIQSVAC